MEENLTRKADKEFELLLSQIDGSEEWTVGERQAFYGFFLHGWYARTGEAVFQKGTIDEGLRLICSFCGKVRCIGAVPVAAGCSDCKSKEAALVDQDGGMVIR